MTTFKRISRGILNFAKTLLKNRPKNRCLSFRGREITVRGPARTDEDLAEDDGDAFRDAFKGGGYEGVTTLSSLFL